ncbi:hypothetical protein ABEB36_001805 [Hypothenemus hampei]|uniref:CHK kinase-like domain-containing protein n=1 Tax=Hypothenemus hampei TaxID=57062 RepID=A0ABD1FFT1_HYPHA
MTHRDKFDKLEELLINDIKGEIIEQKVKLLLPLGENYGSVIYHVDFTVRKDGKFKEYHAVAKCTPPNEVTQELFNIQETFKSEIAWYTTVIPTLKLFAKDNGLERELDFFQKFYGARISLNPNSTVVDLDGVILTENLKYRGYLNIDRHRGFDAPTTFSVLKDIATFHAVPLAIRRKNPKLFDEKLMPYCPKFGMDDSKKDEMDKYITTIYNYIPKLKPYKERILKLIFQSFPFKERELHEPWVTIIHLDLWCNNIMVTGGENSKNIILDFQVPMVGNLAADVIFLLTTSVDLEEIRTRLDEFLRFYYDELIKNLKQLKVDTSEFTFDGFMKEIDHAMRSCEFAHALGHNQIIMMDKGITTLDSSDTKMKKDEIFEEPKPNQRQIEKVTWLTNEALKRQWIYR